MITATQEDAVYTYPFASRVHLSRVIYEADCSILLPTAFQSHFVRGTLPTRVFSLNVRQAEPRDDLPILHRAWDSRDITRLSRP